MAVPKRSDKVHKWSIVIAVVLVAAQGEAQVSLW